MNTTLLIQISVSGLIAILGILSTTIFSYKKYSFDEKRVFEGIMKDKFEKVYTPLKSIILKEENDFSSILFNYRHLISSELLELLDEYYILDKKYQSINEIEKKEFEFLKKRIYELVDKEFKKLHGIYNSHYFEGYKHKYNNQWYKKMYNLTKPIFLVFIVVFIVSFWAYKIIPNPPIFENGYYDFILVIVTVIIEIIILVGSLKTFIDVISFFDNISIRYKNKYSLNDYVLKTGIYKCRTCGKEQNFYKHEKLPNCEKCVNSRNIFKIFRYRIMLYEWINTENKAKKKQNRTVSASPEQPLRE